MRVRGLRSTVYGLRSNDDYMHDHVYPLAPRPKLLHSHLLHTPPARVIASKQAEANPRKLFEDNWVQWLTTFSRTAYYEGVVKAVEFVLDRRMLGPSPTSWPRTVEAAKQVDLLGSLYCSRSPRTAGVEHSPVQHVLDGLHDALVACYPGECGEPL